MLRVGAATNWVVTGIYGIAVSQTPDSEGDEVLVTVSIATSNSNLVGRTILVEIDYIVELEVFALPEIIVTYTETESVTTSDATTLSEPLELPSPIPCLESSSDWVFDIPESADPESTHYTFSCDTLQVLIFDDLTLTVNQAEEQPSTGTYSCNLTLYDVSNSTWEETSAFESYEL